MSRSDAVICAEGEKREGKEVDYRYHRKNDFLVEFKVPRAQTAFWGTAVLSRSLPKLTTVFNTPKTSSA